MITILLILAIWLLINAAFFGWRYLKAPQGD